MSYIFVAPRGPPPPLKKKLSANDALYSHGVITISHLVAWKLSPSVITACAKATSDTVTANTAQT